MAVYATVGGLSKLDSFLALNRLPSYQQGFDEQFKGQTSVVTG